MYGSWKLKQTSQCVKPQLYALCIIISNISRLASSLGDITRRVERISVCRAVESSVKTGIKFDSLKYRELGIITLERSALLRANHHNIDTLGQMMR